LTGPPCHGVEGGRWSRANAVRSLQRSEGREEKALQKQKTEACFFCGSKKNLSTFLYFPPNRIASSEPFLIEGSGKKGRRGDDLVCALIFTARGKQSDSFSSRRTGGGNNTVDTCGPRRKGGEGNFAILAFWLETTSQTRGKEGAAAFFLPRKGKGKDECQSSLKTAMRPSAKGGRSLCLLAEEGERDGEIFK